MFRLEAASVHATYGEVVALNSLSCTFTPGTTALLGPNGAGKSTLIRLLTASVDPMQGSVLWGGTSLKDEATRAEYARHLGYLPQDFTFVSGFTVKEVITCVATLREMSPEAVQPHVLSALNAVGLGDLANRRISRLSGGQRRRAGIAQAIVNDPSTLVLDEPTSGLDPSQRTSFRKLLRRRPEGTITILSTHLIEDVVATCDFVKIIANGEMLFDGTVGEMKRLAPSGTPEERQLEEAYNYLLGGEQW